MSGFQGNWFEIFEDIKKEFDAEKAKLQKLIQKTGRTDFKCVYNQKKLVLDNYLMHIENWK